MVTETDGNGGEFTQVVISDEADVDLFAYVAAVLQDELHGNFAQKLNGVDQAYWHLESGDGKIVLHLEHYLGICIHPADLSLATNATKALVMNAYEVIAQLSRR